MFPPELVFLFTIFVGLSIATINIAFAMGVFIDSARMINVHGRQTKIVPGPMWAFATLIGGVFVATAYWFIHHSKLSYRD
jgi:uncharacterized membrane protein YoaK (UPF0700 family)